MLIVAQGTRLRGKIHLGDDAAPTKGGDGDPNAPNAPPRVRECAEGAEPVPRWGGARSEPSESGGICAKRGGGHGPGRRSGHRDPSLLTSTKRSSTGKRRRWPRRTTKRQLEPETRPTPSPCDRPRADRAWGRAQAGSTWHSVARPGAYWHDVAWVPYCPHWQLGSCQCQRAGPPSTPRRLWRSRLQGKRGP